jgi:hypothetical protein
MEITSTPPSWFIVAQLALAASAILAAFTVVLLVLSVVSCGGGDQVVDVVFLPLRCVAQLGRRAGGARHRHAVFRCSEDRSIPNFIEQNVLMELVLPRSDPSIRKLLPKIVLPIR